jgi:hypothetical protein
MFFNKSRVASEAQSRRQSEAAAGANWHSILSKADAGRARYREAVAALNVKVICDLSPLVRDRSKYESFRREAIDLAMSIQDERYRTFAIKQLKGLSRSAGARPWREPMPDDGKTRLVARERPRWLSRERMRDGSKTPLI